MVEEMVIMTNDDHILKYSVDPIWQDNVPALAVGFVCF